MIGLPAGTRIWITAGVTDLRRGFTGLSGMVQTALQENPFSGHVFVFRGRRGDLIKMLWWDGHWAHSGLAFGSALKSLYFPAIILRASTRGQAGSRWRPLPRQMRRA